MFMYSPCHIIQLALQKKNVMEFFFYVLKYRFSIIPKVFIRCHFVAGINEAGCSVGLPRSRLLT